MKGINGDVWTLQKDLLSNSVRIRQEKSMRSMLLFEPSVKTLVFSRIPKTAMVQPDSLKKFEGDYLIGQMVLKVFLQNNALHLSVPGQPEYELVPIGENKFSLKDMSGFTITSTGMKKMKSRN